MYIYIYIYVHYVHMYIEQFGGITTGKNTNLLD